MSPKKPQYYPSPRWSGEILDCSVPLSFDQFSRCSYDCAYCFSFFQRAVATVNPIYKTKEKLYSADEARPVNVDRVCRLFRGEIPGDQFWPFISRRYYLQWGGLSDPFDEFERRKGVALEILRTMDEVRQPICFSTKGTWWTEDERYMRLFRRNRDIWNVKFSIINLDEGRSRRVETGCPSPAERLAAIRRLVRDTGAKATLRLRPFIIGMSDVEGEYLELVRRAREAGAGALSTEFFCMEGRCIDQSRYDRMSKALGFDMPEFYRQNSMKKGGYMRLNWRIKQPYIEEMERMCRRIKMRFYVSDAHWKGRSCNGSCCGLLSSENYHRGQYTEALLIARRKGRVRWGDIEPLIEPSFRKLKAVESVNFMRGSPSIRAKFYHFSLFDMMRYFWNNPKAEKSPYRYFSGAMAPVGKDENGDLIYEYRGLGDETP